MVKKKRSINSIIAIVVICIVIVFGYMCKELKVDTFRTRDIADYEVLTNLDYYQIEDEKAPQGVVDVYSFTLDRVLPNNISLVMYTFHENVDIFIDNRLVYSSSAREDNVMGHTPGNIWSEVPILQGDSGEKVEIRLTPVYKTHIGFQPEIMLGNAFKIYADCLISELVSLVCAIVTLVLGLIFLSISLIQFRGYKNKSGLLILSILAVVLGSWKLSDLSVMHLYMNHSIEYSYRALLLIMLLGIPFSLYQKELFESKYKKIFDYIACVDGLAVMLTILLQIFDVVDLREMLWLHHIMLLIILGTSVALLIYELIRFGWSKKNKIIVFSFMICGAGILGDLILFYGSYGHTEQSLGMVAFLFYISVFGVMSMREAQKWMELGQHASDYQNMAFHDELTGLFNRNAYARYIGSDTFRPKGCTFVMLDLNDLKKCNDTYGHNVGDRYIREGAKAIDASFGKLGNVYRMGGDEFCAILPNVSEEACTEAREKLQKLTDKYNEQVHDVFDMKIACGYSVYDEERDFDIGDTLRHADHDMYENKIKMKQK